MAGELPTRILLSISDLMRSEVDQLSDAEAWKLIYQLKPIKRDKSKDDKPQVCFSGFSVSEKRTLEELAIDNGMHVSKSITKNLRYFVTGENCGPKKLEAALAQEVTILDKMEFLRLLETGEIPSDRVFQ